MDLHHRTGRQCVFRSVGGERVAAARAYPARCRRICLLVYTSTSWSYFSYAGADGTDSSYLAVSVRNAVAVPKRPAPRATRWRTRRATPYRYGWRRAYMDWITDPGPRAACQTGIACLG